MKKRFHWFKVHVNFDCPSCQLTSIQRMVLSSQNHDMESINQQIQSDPFKCQMCSSPLDVGTPVYFDVRSSAPPTVEELWEYLRGEK
jgi:hypothetical protein